MSKKQEHIICAAIYYDDKKEHAHSPRNIKTGIVVCGRRHHNCYAILGELFPDFPKIYLPTDVQGFLTSHDRFVDRAEAYVIAEAANQLIPEEVERMVQRNTNHKELFSEHLY